MSQQVTEPPKSSSLPQDKEEEPVEQISYSNTSEAYPSIPNPNALNNQQIHVLQKTHGNQYVTHLMDNHKTRHLPFNAPKLSGQFSITDKLQRIQTKPKISSDDIQLTRDVEGKPAAKLDNPNTNTSDIDPTSLLSNLDGAKTQWQASGQATQGTLDKTKTTERIEKAKSNAQLVSQVSLGIMLASAGLSFFGIGVPVTPLLVGLSATAGVVGLIISTALQSLLTSTNASNSSRPYMVGPQGTNVISSASESIVSQLDNSEQSTSSIEAIDKQIADIQAGKDRIRLDIDDAKLKNAKSLDDITKLKAIVSTITDPIKDVFGKLLGIGGVIGNELTTIDVKDKDKAKEIKATTEGVTDNNPDINRQPIMRTPKITVTPRRQPIQRMIWETAIRPLIIVIKEFLKQTLAGFLANHISPLFTYFKTILETILAMKSELSEKEQLLLEDKKRLEENENKAKIYQSQSDALLKKKESEKQSIMAGEDS